ncbi:MAG: hypothetical protein ACJ735_07910 [Actinomycetes bacterium]
MSAQADVASVGAAERQSRLAARVRNVRTRAGAGQLDRWLLIIGGVLLPLGVLLILLGWLGASRTILPFEQIPYVVSGGLLGIAFVIIGGFVYFAYWQTLLVRDTRAERRELVDALYRIERLLSGGGLITSNGELPAHDEAPLVATENGSMIHRTDCPVVLNRDNLRSVSPGTPGLRPCSICDPLAASAEATH